MTQFTCKGVKQINNRISFKHLYHSYLSAFFISAGVLMFTRAIFIRPDSKLIRESVCACAKLFVDEESTWHKSNRRRTKTLTDSIVPVNPLVKVSNRSITGYHLNIFTIRISRHFSSAQEFQMGNFQKY
jgi:hypothetical protein